MYDERVDPFRRRGVGDRLGVISRGDRDHAALLFVVGERRELVQHAPRFEGAGALEKLGLEPDVGADLVGERGRAKQRRPVQPVADALARTVDVVEGDERARRGHREIVLRARL